MRPLTLEISGFRSWEALAIDFSDRGVLTLLGDTGAGKSSILDAIAFALYSRTPEESRSGRLLRSGAEHGEVRLTFSAGGRTLRATRRLGSGAPEPAHLLEEIRDGAPTRLATGDAEITAEVTAATGMGFAAFSSAILLAQGRFAEFLVAAPRRRDEVLREVFEVVPLEGAREAAVGAAARYEGEATALEQQATAAPDAGARLISTGRAARGSAADLSALRLTLPRLEKADALKATIHEREQRAQELDDAVARVPSAAERTRIEDAHASARAAAEAAEASLMSARAEATSAMEALGAGRTRLGGDGVALSTMAEVARAFEAARDRLPDFEVALESAKAALDKGVAADRTAEKALAEVEARAKEHLAHREAHERKTAAEAKLSLREKEAATAAGTADTCDEALVRAENERAAAEKAREEAHAAHAAAHLREGLSPGDDCPVCSGVVGIIEGVDEPDADAAAARVAASRAAALSAEGAAARAHAASAAATEARDGAAAELEAAAAALEAAPTAKAVGVEDLDAAQKARHAAAAELARAQGALSARQDELARAVKEQANRKKRLGQRATSEDPVVQILAAADEMAALEERGHLAGAALQTALSAADEARSRAQTLAEGERAQLAESLAKVVALLEREGVPIGKNPLEDAERRAEWCRADAVRSRAVVDDLLGTTADIPGIAEPERRAALLESARGRAGDHAASFRACRSELRAASEAATAAAAARAAAGRHHQVAEDLKANRFPRFVLERHRRRLAERASAWLTELTDGNLAFAAAEPDPLAIVDQRLGEAPRPASSLSGGERFLASLALALGLGDIAGEGAGRPDSLFLDEGFAALDADALDQALTAVERVAADGRLVVVITHLAGVAERLGDALRVEKGPDGISRLSAHDEPIVADAGLVRAT